MRYIIRGISFKNLKSLNIRRALDILTKLKYFLHEIA